MCIEGTTPLSRLKHELCEQQERLDQLTTLLNRTKPSFITEQEWDLMKEHQAALAHLIVIIQTQINLHV